MAIKFVLLVNKQGQTRVAQYYEYKVSHREGRNTLPPLPFDRPFFPPAFPQLPPSMSTSVPLLACPVALAHTSRGTATLVCVRAKVNTSAACQRSGSPWFRMFRSGAQMRARSFESVLLGMRSSVPSWSIETSSSSTGGVIYIRVGRKGQEEGDC